MESHIIIVTNELCTAACKSAGYPLAGTEYSGECYCGQVFSNGGAPATSGCNMVCNGNSSEICGGPNRLSVWSRSGSGSSSSATASTVSAVSTISAASTASPTSTGTAAGTLPSGWSYKGCYAEGTTGRAFVNQQPDSQTLTVESCVSACLSLGYSVAGVEYSYQCFCDNSLHNGAAPAPESDCNMGCAGNANENCGAGNRLSVYSNTALTVFQPPSPQTTGLPGSWQYVGCILYVFPSP